MNDHLIETVEDGVAVLTLNRPERLNAMSGPMMTGMAEALPRLAVAYGYMKKNLNATAAGASLKEVFDLEAWHMTRTGMTEDHREAAKAFVEKRVPVFQGR